jgi:hypothetical protein
MRNNDRYVAGFFVIIISFCLGYCSGLIAHAHAQDREMTPDQTALATAYLRVFIGEAGWNANEHAAIAHTVRRRAERLQMRLGWSEIQTLRAYARNSLGHPHSARSVWVTSLELGCEQPNGWPRRIAWSIYRGWCQAAAERAVGWVRGYNVMIDPCHGPTEHWGGPGIARDRDRMGRALLSRRWRVVNCGETSNVFLAVVP